MQTSENVSSPLLEDDSEDDNDTSSEEPIEGSNNLYDSHLFKMLMDHADELLMAGVSYGEVERFLSDPDSLRNFFEARGLYFPRPDEVCTSEIDERSSSNNPENECTSRLGRVIRLFFFGILFLIACVIGHISICHVLDINPLKHFPSIQEKRCLLPAHPILMEMTRPVADCGFCKNHKNGDSEGIIIEMMTSPTKHEFAKVAYLSKPVIIRGGGTKGGMPEGFNFERLKDIFQSEPGGVDAVSEECQFLPFRSPFTSLREAFDKIEMNSSFEEPWYIGWSNCHPGVAAKLRELFPRPDFLPEDSSSSAIDWIFIGSPGLGASMHIDYVKRPSWQAQLSGIKRWILHPPPECEAVCPESVTFSIFPGDMLFLETNCWYHQTQIMDEGGLSISIGSEYD